MAKSQKEEYIFSSDHDIEEERLKRLNEAYNERTISFLKDKIKPGSKVLEIGFGTGEVSRLLAQNVKNITYYGIDPDQTSHKIAVSSASVEFPNLHYICKGIDEIQEVPEIAAQKFDVIFMRWTLAYTKKENFDKNLQTLYSMLNEGGVLLCEECNVYSVKSVSSKEQQEKVPTSSVAKWINLTEKADARFNANFRLGKEIPEIMRKSTGQTVFSEKFQPCFTDKRYKEIVILGLQSAKKVLVENSLITNEEITLLIDQYNEEVVSREDVALKYVKNTSCWTVKENSRKQEPEVNSLVLFPSTDLKQEKEMDK